MPSWSICPRRRAMQPDAGATPPAVPPPPGIGGRASSAVGLLPLWWTFVRLGIVSFGGGLQSWVHREIVERLGWLDHQEFLSGLTVAQIVPGANPVNLALYVGLRLRGGLGALLAVLGLIIPALGMVLLLGYLYHRHGQLPVVHFVLLGLAATGVGSMLNMGIKLTRRLPGDWPLALVGIAVFVCIAVLRWPLLPVLAVAAPLGVAIARATHRDRLSGEVHS